MRSKWNLCFISTLALLTLTEAVSFAGANDVFNVKDYGAVGDEKTVNTGAIVADNAEGILIDGAILPKSEGAECHVLVRGGKGVELRNSELVLKDAMEKSREDQTLRIQWLPLTMDQGYIEDCVKLAGEFEVDAFHLSHTIVHDAEDVIDNAKRRSEVIKAMKTMKDAGLEIWCWTHEIKKLPPGIKKGQFSLRDPLLKKFLQDKYDNFLTDVLPDLDGIILTLAETGVKVYQNVTADEAHARVVPGDSL